MVYFIALLLVIYAVLYFISRLGLRRTGGDAAAGKDEQEFNLLSAPESPLVIAHRGGAGLGPENTLSACQLSAELGVDMLELDVRLTADSELVAHHDASIDRMSDGSGQLEEKTLAELGKYDFSRGFTGEGKGKVKEAAITPLEDILAEFQELRFTVEIKDDGQRGKKAVDELMEIFTRYERSDSVIVGSFHDEVLDYLARKYPGQVAYSASRLEVGKFVVLNLLRLGGLYGGDISALQIPTSFRGINLVRTRFIEAAHKLNIAVHYWTVNSPAEMERLIDLGADGIITDRPDILMELLEN